MFFPTLRIISRTTRRFLYREKRRTTNWVTDHFKSAPLAEIRMLAAARTLPVWYLASDSELHSSRPTCDGRAQSGDAYRNQQQTKQFVELPDAAWKCQLRSSAFPGWCSRTQSNSENARRYQGNAHSEFQHQTTTVLNRPRIFCDGLNCQSDSRKFPTIEQCQQCLRELGVCPKCFKKEHAIRHRRGQQYSVCKAAHKKEFCLRST